MLVHTKIQKVRSLWQKAWAKSFCTNTSQGQVQNCRANLIKVLYQLIYLGADFHW